MQYARDAYDTHNVLCNKVPMSGGWGVGRVLTVAYLAYVVVPPRLTLVPWVGMAEACATLTASFRPVTLITDYTSCASLKHLMCICFPLAPHARRAVPLRQCVHKRRLAKRFGACTVGTERLALCC